jgi:hypothetical protein
MNTDHIIIGKFDLFVVLIVFIGQMPRRKAITGEVRRKWAAYPRSARSGREQGVTPALNPVDCVLEEADMQRERGFPAGEKKPAMEAGFY